MRITTYQKAVAIKYDQKYATKSCCRNNWHFRKTMMAKTLMFLVHIESLYGNTKLTKTPAIILKLMTTLELTDFAMQKQSWYEFDIVDLIVR